MTSATQPGLFDRAMRSENGDAAVARVRLREAIGRLSEATVPPWRREDDVVLADGAFRRAMRHLPSEEADALWAEYDGHMHRLYAAWSASRPGG